MDSDLSGPIDFLKEVFRDNSEKDSIVWKNSAYSYAWLLERVEHWQIELEKSGVASGSVVCIEGDFSPDAASLFLALAERACILVPLTHSVAHQKDAFIELAEGEVEICLDANDEVQIRKLPNTAKHEYYQELRERGHPGLVLFSSGSTGESKAAVHDLLTILEKFKTQRKSMRAVSFLLYDHIGGVNTMLYTLSNGGCMVTVQERTPAVVLSAIEKFNVELLPTSPTFINLILLSEAYKEYDLSSLRMVTYGTESMPQSTLEKFHALFPAIQLLQTYGLSEVGILRSKSKSSDSLWVKVGGEGFETRVVDNILHIKSQSAMLGYLNAASPFTADGWMITGDVVEVDGEYLKFLGRDSEIINVGGEKVYPAEVESVIQAMDNVLEVTVHGESNPITGSIVCARISLGEEEGRKAFLSRMKAYCRGSLQPYKIPVKAEIISGKMHSDRFKKMRRKSGGIHAAQ